MRAKGLKARGLDLGSVSGDINVSDVTCDRLGVKSVSGNVEYAGGIAKGGRYEINAHSGTVRLVLANPAGLRAERQQLQRIDPVGAADDDRRRFGAGTATAGAAGTAIGNHSMRATFGDGSATLVVRTFSGDIIIAKR